MSDPIQTACPSCGKALQVPAAVAGKTIRCKACQATFAVPAAGGKAPVIKAAPAKPKPKPKSPDADAPMKFADEPPKPSLPGQRVVKRPSHDDDDDDPNPYGVTKDELDVPRCPFCANELDPPDTKVCLTCGYDLLDRKRHGSKRVYELSNGEYFMHWLPAFIWIAVVCAAIGISVTFYIMMYDWMEGTIIQQEEKDFATNKSKWYVEPLCFNIFTWVICAFIIFKGVRFAYRRLVIDWRPEETIKK